jgi:polyisoprenoid-binding protein YceI
MAIGSSINVSLPTVGTTVHTLAKANVGKFSKTVTVSSEDAQIVLTLRAASMTSRFKSLGATYKYDPSINDSPNDARSGSVTVSVNVNASVGAVLTRAEVLNHIRYALSGALKTDLLEALFDGSLE